MSAIVDAIRAEREQLLAPIADKLAALDALERMAGVLNGAGEARPAKPAAAPAKQEAAAATVASPGRCFTGAAVEAPTKRVLPPKSSVTRVGTDRLGDKARLVLTAIRSQGASWAAAGEIYRALPSDAGITYGAIGNHLQKLYQRNLIVAEGQTAARRYRAATVEDRGLADESPPAPPTADTVPADAPPAHVARDARAERVEGPALGGSSTTSTAGDSNEQSLAEHLNAEREHIADILGRLLLEDKVVLDPDGCYRNTA